MILVQHSSEEGKAERTEATVRVNKDGHSKAEAFNTVA